MTDKDYEALSTEYEDYILKVIHSCPDFNPDHWKIEDDKVVPALDGGNPPIRDKKAKEERE